MSNSSSNGRRTDKTDGATQPWKAQNGICLDFLQVTFDGPSGRVDPSSSSKVRAHVMRNYHHKRRVKKDPAVAEDGKLRLTKSKKVLPVTEKVLETRTSHRPKAEYREGFQHTIQIYSPLGAGKIDPFLQHPDPVIRLRYFELMDYCITTAWPGIRDDYTIFSAATWAQIVGGNPITMHSLICTASSHLESLSLSSVSAEYRSTIRFEQMQAKIRVIRAVREILKTPFAISDALIQCILLLAVNETRVDERPRDWSPFTPPFKNLQWLEVRCASSTIYVHKAYPKSIYGLRTYEPNHIKALHYMLHEIGGIRNIRLYGLAWGISCAELICLGTSLDRPQFPHLDPSGKDLIFILFDINSDGPPNPQPIIYRFAFLQNPSLGPELFDVFLKIKIYSQQVGKYEHSRGVLPNLLADNRNLIMHSLLKLPPAAELFLEMDTASDDFQEPISVYEICRLTCLMYSIHVIFPVPRSRPARLRLLPLMKKAIQDVEILRTGTQQLKRKTNPARPLQELVLWCITIGGIAAKSQVERAWYTSELRMVCAALGLKKWVDVAVVLRQFPWVDSACDSGGEELWDEGVGAVNF